MRLQEAEQKQAAASRRLKAKVQGMERQLKTAEQAQTQSASESQVCM